MKILLTFIAVFISYFQLASAQIKPVHWNKQLHNFGRVEENVPVVYDFEFTNITNHSIRIESVITNCKCIIPFWSNEFIEPNEIAKIRVTFKEHEEGLFKQQLKVAISDYEHPEIIQIYASVGMDFPKPPISNTPSINQPSRRPPSTNNSPLESEPSIVSTKPLKPSLPPTATSSNSTSVDFEKEALNTGRYANYLSTNEKQMIVEINRVRSNPKAYVLEVQNYVDELKEKMLFTQTEEKKILQEEINSAVELMGILRVTPKLSILRPHKNLQRAAREHGLYLARTAKLTHTGANGSDPLERIISYAPELAKGAENLIANQQTIQAAIRTLLIDPGYSSRPHRKIILDSQWEFVACFSIGNIGSLQNAWTQNFAKSKKLMVRPLSEATQPSKPTNAGTGMNVPGRPSAPGRRPRQRINQPPGRMAKPKPVESANTPISATPPGRATTSVSSPIDLMNGINYLTSREKAMIMEINLLRTRPKEYVIIVENYIDDMRKTMESDPSNKSYYEAEIFAAVELVRELKVMKPLKPLSPHESVFEAANKHAVDMKRTGNFNHLGSDNSYPWTRILRADPNLKDGNENLVAGPKEIRKSLLFLLVDAAIPERGHRKNILRADWKYIICHEIGTVDRLPNCWIQCFAK